MCYILHAVTFIVCLVIASLRHLKRFLFSLHLKETKHRNTILSIIFSFFAFAFFKALSLEFFYKVLIKENFNVLEYREYRQQSQIILFPDFILLAFVLIAVFF